MNEHGTNSGHGDRQEGKRRKEGAVREEGDRASSQYLMHVPQMKDGPEDQHKLPCTSSLVGCRRHRSYNIEKKHDIKERQPNKGKGPGGEIGQRRRDQA
jgi:hypothetical protein